MVTREEMRSESTLSQREMGRHKTKSAHHNKRSTRGLTRDVDQNTKEGMANVQASQLESALESFKVAYMCAHELGEGFTIRACAFNLGAVYIAAGQPTKGIDVLKSALPPQNQHDEKSSGDLFYNFALGYEALKNRAETACFLELALEEYQVEKDNYKMEAEVTSKLAGIYTQSQEWLEAARANCIGSHAYAMLGDFENQAASTCHEASSLYQGQRPDLALQIADNCMLLCQKVDDTESLSSLYNELGLTYTLCRDFAKAATCFELALPLSRSPKGDRKQMAVILQNLGAVYNSLGDFQRAISHHVEAARQHAELKNRSAQGDCFTNLAFAYSQVGDTDRAGEFYLHAMQASRDTGDSHGQWQAMEGMGAVAFNDGKFDLSVRHFKMALALLAGTEKNEVAQERLVAKLTDAIQCAAGSDMVNKRVPNEVVDILINDKPRPPTREEQLQMLEHAQLRKERRNLGKRQNQFIPVALGVTDYETDSDISLQREKQKSRSRSRRSNKRHLDRSSSLSSSRPENISHSGLNTANTMQLSQIYTGLKRRQDSVPRDVADGKAYLGRRRHNCQRPLLRTNSFDSDEERFRIINQPRRGSHGDSSTRTVKRTQHTTSDVPGVESSKPGSAANVPLHYAAMTRSSRRLSEVTDTQAPDDIVETDSEWQTDSETAESDSEGSEEDSKEYSEEDDNNKSDEDGQDKTLLPSAPPVPINSPNSTYLQPYEPSNDVEVRPNREGNYFKRDDDNESTPVKNGRKNFKQITNKPEVNFDIDDDPVYQTIRSVKGTMNTAGQPQPSTARHVESDGEAPPLPPRQRYSTLTKTEKKQKNLPDPIMIRTDSDKEAFLFDYERKRGEDIQLREEQLASGANDPNLPSTNRKGSKTCVLM